MKSLLLFPTHLHCYSRQWEMIQTCIIPVRIRGDCLYKRRIGDKSSVVTWNKNATVLIRINFIQLLCQSSVCPTTLYYSLNSYRFHTAIIPTTLYYSLNPYQFHTAIVRIIDLPYKFVPTCIICCIGSIL